MIINILQKFFTKLKMRGEGVSKIRQKIDYV